jgi:Fe-S cluster assembly protein SufD
MSSPITLTAFEDRLFADLPEDELTAVLRSRGLPSRRTETWKWSDLRGALREAREPSGAYDGDDPQPILSTDGATILTLRNGRPEAPRGVEPKPILHEGEKIGVTYVVEDGLVLSFYDEGRAPEAAAPGSELAALAAAAPLISISVLPGFTHRIAIRRLSDGEGQHTDSIYLTVGEGASATLLETHEITGKPFVNSRTEIEVDAGATLRRYVAQPSAPEAVVVHTAELRLAEEEGERRAKVEQTILALGAHLARHETRAVQLGAGEMKADALYRLEEALHTDITSHLTFAGEGGQADQLVKGIAGGRSRGVFQGKFLVERGAQQTDAQMAHHALLLSKGAQINAKPELEIYADDVECAHGNTAGAIDPDALFYMRQRGVPEEEARGLLIEAFAAEVLDRIGEQAVRASFERLLTESVI